MEFKFSKNTIYKGKLHKAGSVVDAANAESLEERGFGTIITEPAEDTTAPGDDETNAEDTTAPGDDETNGKGKKPVSQSTARKGSRADAK